jgi:hypothetical protein
VTSSDVDERARERPLGLVADYELGPLFAAVPPSQGVYRGAAMETLEVAVTISEP